MIKWLETRNWEKAFLDIIPGRKLKESKWIGDEDQAGQGEGNEVTTSPTADNDDGSNKKNEDNKEDSVEVKEDKEEEK